jgi:hypothetical protein
MHQGEIGKSSGAQNGISNPNPETPVNPDETMRLDNPMNVRNYWSRISPTDGVRKGRRGRKHNRGMPICCGTENKGT